MSNFLISLGLFVVMLSSMLEPQTDSAFLIHISIILFGMALIGSGLYLKCS